MPSHDAPSDQTVERERIEPPFGAPHVFVLAAMEGPDPVAVHRVSQPETVIGRGDDVAFRIDDDQISKHHALIRVDGSVCSVMDLESRNGTVLNGRPLRQRVAQRVRHLDEIHLGGTRLMVLTARFRPQKKD